MWDLVGNIKIGKNGLAYVVDKKGNLLAYGDISRVLAGENLSNLHEVARFVNGEHTTEGSVTSNGIGNLKVVTSHVALEIPDWAVVVELPIHEAYEPLKDIIKNSDNIGMSLIIRQLGLKSFLQYYSLLGLSNKSGIDLQGESKPISKNIWPEIDLATASFGQGIAINQIQMLTAFNTLANEGKLVSPKIVRYLSENDQTIVSKKTPSRQVFKPTTTQTVKEILKYSVENGSIARLKPKNIEACAKSGTAQVAVKGGYTDDNTVASYVGFSPCDNAKFTMIITINRPRTTPWGASSAAPLWYDLAEKLNFIL